MITKAVRLISGQQMLTAESRGWSDSRRNEKYESVQDKTETISFN